MKLPATNVTFVRFWHVTAQTYRHCTPNLSNRNQSTSYLISSRGVPRGRMINTEPHVENILFALILYYNTILIFQIMVITLFFRLGEPTKSRAEQRWWLVRQLQCFNCGRKRLWQEDCFTPCYLHLVRKKQNFHIEQKYTGHGGGFNLLKQLIGSLSAKLAF